MNIKVQCCGVILITLLAIIYGRQKKLNLITSRVFQGCFFASLFCLCMDILSLVMIVYREKFPLFLTEFICKTYLASLVLVALLAVVYIATSVTFHLPHYKKNIVVYVVLAAIFTAAIYALPIYMHENVEMDMAWTDGACIYATYLGIMVFVAINLVQMFRRKEYIYDRQRRTVLIWMLMWMTAACIQVLDSKNLLAGFAIALGITVIFFQFENPELNLDWQTGLFNYVAYTRYGEQLYSSDKDFYLIAVMYENTTWQSEESSYTNIDAQKIFDTFLTIRDANVFKITENEVLIFFSSEERVKTTWENIMKWSKSRTAKMAPGHPSFYYIEDTRCVSSYGELFDLLQYVGLQRKDSRPGSLHIIKSNIVSQMITERQMTHQIAEALEEDRVVVYYQPIYSIEKQRFVSAEALVRIIDREGNLIPPAAFVHIAESNGMIIEIGRRVFEKVCQFFQQNRLGEYGIQYIDVNLSVVQCADDHLADTYIKIMDDIKMDPHCINLEITESASLREKQVLITNMEQMIEHGIMFSLDDFGTGQANLNYIMEMPVNVVKFDREMIQSYFSNDKARYIMDAAMQMIHGMKMKIVAEGIETEEQYKKMEEINIGFIQGYYFSKPLPEQEFLEFLRQKNRLCPL